MGGDTGNGVGIARDDISHASATPALYDERLYQAGPIMRLHRSIEVR
jgi:hypothetical protein